jgi:hypothetical protein
MEMVGEEILAHPWTGPDFGAVSSNLRQAWQGILRGVGRPTRALNAELLCVLGGQSLPAAELHDLGADDVSNRLTREEPLKDVEADVPAQGYARA